MRAPRVSASVNCMEQATHPRGSSGTNLASLPDQVNAVKHGWMNEMQAVRWPRVLVFSSLALVLLLLIALWTVDRRAEERALRNLPEADRRALYERTLENVRTVCARDASSELVAYCRDQAEVLLALPECDAACKALVGSYRHRATR